MRGPEDEIADRIEAILPVPAEHEALVSSLLPDTIAVYYDAFSAYTAWEQLAIQADAEKTGLRCLAKSDTGIS